jgi:predicted RNA-binding protein with PUA-like domain
MKSEEDDYSISDLKRDGKIHWYGVRNYQARNFMRDHMKLGDTVLFYHSNGKPSGIVGVGKVASLPYPDITQFDSKSNYYHKKATPEKPTWILIEVAYVKTYKVMLPIHEMRMHHDLTSMKLLEKGNRLSITPVTKEEFGYIDKILS